MIAEGYYVEYGETRCKICKKKFKKQRYNSVYCCEECRKKGNSIKCMGYVKRRYKVDPDFRKRRKEDTKRWRESKRSEDNA